LRMSQALKIGDKVSAQALCWGDDFAKSEFPDSWRTARWQGTVLGREGIKWLVDFGEDTSSGEEHKAWARSALSFESRDVSKRASPTRKRAASPAKKRPSGKSSITSKPGEEDSSDDEEAEPAHQKRKGTKPLLRHCVLGCFTEEATDEQKEEMLAALRALPSAIAEISSLVVGVDLGLTPGNHAFALNVEFLAEDDYSTYATHPAHLEVIEAFIKPILKPGSRTAVQFALQ